MAASAPGKLILFGEHAVVFGEPALATAINLRAEVFARPHAEWRADGGSLDEPRYRYVRGAVQKAKAAEEAKAAGDEKAAAATQKAADEATAAAKAATDAVAPLKKSMGRATRILLASSKVRGPSRTREP